MKKVIVIAGHAGVGKSSLGRMLAARTGFTLLDSDTLTTPLTSALMKELTGDPNDRMSSQYRVDVRPFQHETLLNTLWDQLEVQVAGVVLVAPFVKELRDAQWREELHGKCESFGYEAEVVWIHCDPKTQYARLTQRNSATDATLNYWDTWANSLPRPIIPSDTVLDNSAAGWGAFQAFVETVAPKHPNADS